MSVEGRKLGGRYEVISRVGGGGMAVVYKARDVLLNRYVAIKVLNESLSNDSEFVRRFSREAQAAASLSHPNIVGVFDVGQENHTHYIVMEYIEGPTLKEYIQQYSPLTPEEIISIASQICDALAYSHENQIIHRDVKPHNILLGYNGRAKVTDFGIARATSSSTITQAGSVMGSVHYFSPEQARGGVIGEKSDIYSLGVVLYEMVTGELPFDGDSAISIAMKHLQEPAVDPAKLNPNVPRSIHNIILRALEKNPDDRYESARAMKQEIDAVFHTGAPADEPRWRTGGDNAATKPMATIGSRPGEESGDPRGETQRSQVGQQTLANLERLRRVPADKDKTVLERTVVWLENVQANMPWWQKALFGLFTFIVIVSLALFAFDTLMGWLGKDSAKMPDVLQKTQVEAQEVLDEEGLKVNFQEVPSNKKKGIVVRQSEKAGSPVKEGSTVDLFVSSGSDQVKMVNVLGSNPKEAKEKLREMGFTDVEAVKEGYDSKYDNGQIHDQKPKPDQKVKVNTPIKLYVNGKEGTVKVPNLVGEYESSIGSTSDYRIEIIYWPHGGVQTGKAFATDPAPGKRVERGGTIKVWIASSQKGRNAEPPPHN
ncbi:Stk1 family PASTA domain-containing Ser/Thr kinase [Salinithrix halophila]|uniref:non-specific serine/threonine protein kinase n=1 Tax=Salinithrix halophila TaxID=1485204 RepID=A0ABV8JC37_9BACL